MVWYGLCGEQGGNEASRAKVSCIGIARANFPELFWGSVDLIIIYWIRHVSNYGVYEHFHHDFLLICPIGRFNAFELD